MSGVLAEAAGAPLWTCSNGALTRMVTLQEGFRGDPSCGGIAKVQYVTGQDVDVTCRRRHDKVPFGRDVDRHTFDGT